MATGDTTDVVKRLRATLPPWFPDLSTAPVINALLTGTADAFSFVYGYLNFAALQTRIKTATGGWLDLIAWDYFGSRFLRRSNELDSSFQTRILQEILRARQTRAAIILMLTQLTGKAPLVSESFNTNDYGSYGTGTMAYGQGLGWGSLTYTNQIFITAFQAVQGIPLISGYGGNLGGYGVGSFAYVDLSQIIGTVTNAEIDARISQTVAAGITAWTDIVGIGAFVPGTAGQLDFNIPQQSAWVYLA